MAVAGRSGRARGEARRAGPLVESRLLAGQFTRLVAGMLVDAHPTTGAAGPPGGALAPRQVRAAVEFIERHADEDLSLSAIATASGVGVRALQNGFRLHLGSTPTAYLRDHRLQRVHDDLVHARAGDGTTVADVAHAWGFGNLGRFARAHREKFGCAPAETLRR
ncbi:MAG: helix-turn-helix domain-containing protein [Gordonia paraffinivorans]